jgi:aldose 1-epimerase
MTGAGSASERAASASGRTVPPPSGEQFEISHGDQRATIVEVGGGIREFVSGQRPVLEPYPLQAMCDGAHGAPLIPWPNRLGGGRYAFDGREYQLAITEPPTGNAIHGLLRWRNWQALERSADRVLVGTRLHPMDGWPFPLDVSIAYSLADDGLTVETSATNIGERPCPYGSGQHPYLSPGAGATLDECTLELRAATRILTDPEHQLPTGRQPVDGTRLDFNSVRRIGEVEIDDAFTDLQREGDGRVWVRLGCPDGRTVELWCDDAYSVVQLYTGDTLAPARRRLGLAAEPMTCAANAFQTGQGVVRLEPGQRHVGRWGVRLS